MIFLHFFLSASEFGLDIMFFRKRNATERGRIWGARHGSSMESNPIKRSQSRRSTGSRKDSFGPTDKS